MRGMALVAMLLAAQTDSTLADATDYPVPAWAKSQVTSAMREGSRMHLVATGGVAVAFERVQAVLMHTNILKDVEASYLRELPAGAQTNLMITVQRAKGHYTVDWKDEQAEVRDVWRQTDTNNFLEGGYVVTGERFFGSFETVMTIRVQRTPEGQACFRADVLIYPHNGLVRFLFNNLFSVEDYFRDVLVEMSEEIKRVCINLCKAQAATVEPERL